MENTVDTVNRLFAEVFNDFVKIEQKALKDAGFEDITTTETHTLEAIDLYGDRDMSTVADKLDITVGTLTVSVANLVKKGYVLRSRSEADRRKVILRPTERGRELLEAHRRFHKDMVSSAVLGLTEHETEVFRGALLNLSRFFTEKTTKRHTPGLN